MTILAMSRRVTQRFWQSLAGSLLFIGLLFVPNVSLAQDSFWSPVERETAIRYLDQLLDRVRHPTRYYPGYRPGQPLRVVFDADGVLLDGHDEWREVKGAARFVQTCLALSPEVIIEVATARELWHQERTRSNLWTALGLRAGGLEGGRIHVHYNKHELPTEDYKHQIMGRFAAEPGQVVAALENTPANSIAWWRALHGAGKNGSVMHFLVTAQLHHAHERQKREILQQGIDLKKIHHYHGYPRFERR